MTIDRGHGGTGPRVPRRLILKSLAAGVVLWEPACGAPPLDPATGRTHAIAAARPQESPIRIENRLPGSNTLDLQRPATNQEVEGYAKTTSASAGDVVEICVNVDHAQGVRWDLYRIGYYQGLGARLLASGEAVQVAPQPAPSVDPNTGLMECQWGTAFAVIVDAAWVTGYYLFKLTNDDGLESYVPLIVRESERQSPLLMQASVTTWQAYNGWGGLSLYWNHLPGSPAAFTGPRAYQVSFDRPYAYGADIGWVEFAMVRWLEQQGYDVAYATNIDIDRTPELLNGRLLFMTVGHDEYWSLTERNAVQAARDQGLSLAFFSGNPAYRRIRLDASLTGEERRVVTCYKSATLDPHQDAPDTTNDYHGKPFPRPENELTGVVWAGWANLQGFPFVVTTPEHWLYEGTGVKAGDTLGQVVGYEWDTVSNNGVSPDGLEIIAESPVVHEYGYISTSHATVYYPTPSSFVFAAGTVGWAKGLSEAGVADAKVQRVTENVLLRAGLFPEARVVVPPSAPQARQNATRVSVFAGTGAPGHTDGPLSSAQFHSPAGVASGPDGSVFVCDAGSGSVRRIGSDGQVTTVLGHSSGKFRPNLPIGIAVDGSGNVYVSDAGSHQIIVLESDGRVTSFAGRPHRPGLTDADKRAHARFNQPRGLALDADGNLHVADFRNDAIRRIDASGVTTVVASAGGPTALAIAPDGTLYYIATWLGAIVRVSTSGVRSVLANTTQTYGDQIGPGSAARLRPTEGLLLTDNALLFSDTANNRVRSLAFDRSNTVSNVLGTGRGGNGVSPEAELCLPRGLTAVPGGFVVADCLNHRLLFCDQPAT